MFILTTNKYLFKYKPKPVESHNNVAYVIRVSVRLYGISTKITIILITKCKICMCQNVREVSYTKKLLTKIVYIESNVVIYTVVPTPGNNKP